MSSRAAKTEYRKHETLLRWLNATVSPPYKSERWIALTMRRLRRGERADRR